MLKEWHGADKFPSNLITAVTNPRIQNTAAICQYTQLNNMIPHFSDYEVEDDEGNFAYGHRSGQYYFREDESEQSGSHDTYPSGEPFIRTAEGVFDLVGHHRVPLRFYDSTCIICSSASCTRPHRWFTAEGFLHMVGLSGLVRSRSIDVLRDAMEQEYNCSSQEQNRCQVCARSHVSIRDRERAGDCMLPHRWYTWEGYVWSLLGEYGEDSPTNRIKARERASSEWRINGGVGEDSKYEEEAQSEFRKETRYESGHVPFNRHGREYSDRQETSSRTSPPPGWTRSSTGEYKKPKGRDYNEYTTYGNGNSGGERSESTTYRFPASSHNSHSDRFRYDGRRRHRSPHAEDFHDRDTRTTRDSERDFSSSRRSYRTVFVEEEDDDDDHYVRSRGRYYDGDRYGSSFRRDSGSRRYYDDL